MLALDAINHRYLSYALMVVPSNDTFIANAGPTDLPLFNASGVFLGSQSWTITGAQVFDAGTEINSPLLGAAFVAGVDATLSPFEGGTTHLQPVNGLDNVIGLTTPAGTVIGTALSQAPLLRISVTAVPEPATYGYGAVAALAGIIAWRRRRSCRAA